MKKLLILTILGLAIIGAWAGPCYAPDSTVPVTAPVPTATELPQVTNAGTVGVATSQVTNPQTNITTASMTLTATQAASVMTFSTANLGQYSTLNINMQDPSWRFLAQVDAANGASAWYGTVNCSTGTFVFQNMAGLYIAPGANVNVNNFVATTMNIPAANFLSSNFMLIDPNNPNNPNNILQHLTGTQYSQILNEGTITATGSVALVASAVENRGIIMASAGRVTLASGDKATVSFDQRGLIQVEVNDKTTGYVADLVTGKNVTDAVKNASDHSITAHQVIMTAKTASGIFTNAVNQEGIVKATKLENVNGVISIVADNNIQVSGTMEAPGGTINVESDTNVNVKNTLTLVGDTTIKAGQSINVEADIKSSSGSLTLQAINIICSNNAIISADSLNITGTTINNIITDTPTLSIYQPGPIITISSSYQSPIGDQFTTLEGDNLKATYLKTADVTLKGDDLVTTTSAIAISANTFRVIGERFGSYMNPLNIDTANLIIQRTTGDIDIATSTGIGTSILITGPPDGGFGYILYNHDTKLTLTADHINLVGEGSIYLYGDITFSSLYCTIPGKTIYFEAGHTYTITGVFHFSGRLEDDGTITYVDLKSSEKGVQWFINPQGNNELAYVRAEDSYNLDPRLILGTSLDHDTNSYNWDAPRYWLGTSATPTLWSDTRNWSATDGGAGSAGVPTSVDDVYFTSTSDNACSIDTAASCLSFTIQSGHTTAVTITSGSLTVATDVTLTGSGALTPGSYTITVGRSWINNGGTFTAGTSTVTFNTTNSSNITGTANTAFYTLNLGTTITTGQNKVIYIGNSTTSASLTITATTLNIGSTGFTTVNLGSYNGTPNTAVQTLTVTGNLTLNTGYGNLVSTGSTYAHAINVGGNWINNSMAGFTAGISAVTFTTTGTSYITGTFGTTFYTLNLGTTLTAGQSSTIDIGHTAAAAALTTVATTLNIGSTSQTTGITTVNLGIGSSGTNTVAQMLVATGNLTINAGTTGGGQLVSVGTTYAHTINVSGNWINNSPVASSFNCGHSVVTFNGTTNQSITAGTSHFYDVTLNGASTRVTLLSAVTVDHNLTITNGTLDKNGQTLTVTGTFSYSYKLQESAADMIYFTNYLTINRNSTFTAPADFSVTSLTITTGTLDANGKNITLSSTWTNNGTFIHSNGTVTIGGTGVGQITGTVNTTFYILNLGTTLTAGQSKTIYIRNTTLSASLTITATTLNIGSTSQTTGITTVVLGQASTAVQTLTVTGDLTINAGTTGGGKLSSYGTTYAHVINVGGNWINNSPVANSFTCGISVVTFNGTAKQSITAGTSPFYDVVMNGTSTLVNLSSAVTVNHNLTITNGTLDKNGQTLTVTGTFSYSYKLQESAADMIYFTNYLTINRNSTFTTPADFITIGLTITTGTLDANGKNITISGNWTNSGTFTHNNGTVTFDGTTAISGSSTNSFYNVTINSTKSLTAPSGNINVAGNWINNGTFTHSNGTVTFNGTGTSYITGTADTTFYTLNLGTTLGAAQSSTINIGNSTADSSLTITATTLNIGSTSQTSGVTTVNLGTYSGGTNTIPQTLTVTGDLTINIGSTGGGKLVSTGSTYAHAINVGGNWTNNNTNSGQGFNAGISTVTFNAISIGKTISTGGSSFYNVVFDGVGGAWSVSTANMTVNNIVIANGMLTAPSNTLYVSGNWLQTGGTFTHNSGTVDFNGEGTQDLSIGSSPFYNLTHSGSSTLYVWSYRKSMTINHTLVSGDLTDFPVLLLISNDADLFAHAQSLGQDLVFMDSNGNRLSYQIEYYSRGATSDTAYIWVKLFHISSTSDTTFYMNYGNSNCTSQADPTSVWTNGYLAVWHLANSSGNLNTLDSTWNGYDGTNTDTSVVVGKIDGAGGFNGSTSSIDNGFIALSGSSLTFQAWINIASFQENYPYISTVLGQEDGDTNTALFRMGDAALASNQLQFVLSDGNSQIKLDSTTGLNTNAWYLVTATYDGSSMKIYVNNNTPDVSQAMSGNFSSDGEFYIAQSSAGRLLNGMMDEATVSTVARSAGWIATQYNNQNDPSSFVSFGTQTSNGLTVQGNLSQSGSGKISGGTNSIAVTGNVNISNGEFVSTTGNLSVNGNWTNNGTFTHSNGTVTFNGTTTISGSSTNSFYNVTINSTKSLTAPSGNINVAGNWTNNGTFTHSNGTVTFNGTDTSYITGTSDTEFNILNLGTTLGAGQSKIINIGHSDAGSMLTITVATLNIGSTTQTTGTTTVNLGNNGTQDNITGQYLLINGDLTINKGTTGGGVFVSVSNLGNEIDILGNWTNNGTFTPGHSIVYFDNGAIYGSATHQFYNISFSALVAPSSMSVSGNWRNDGTFTHSNGIVIFNGNTTISGATTTTFYNITITGTLTGRSSGINIEHNWTNNGTFTHNNGTVNFNGTSTSNITGTANTSFYTLNLGASLGLGQTKIVNIGHSAAGSSLEIDAYLLFIGQGAPFTGTVTVNLGNNGSQDNTAAQTLSITNLFLYSPSSLVSRSTVNHAINISSGDLGSTFSAGRSTVTLNGTAMQTETNVSFYNLRISNTSVSGVRGSGTITILSGGTLTVDSGKLFDLAANNATLSVSGSISNSGIIKIGTATPTIPNSTVGNFNYVSNSATVQQATYGDLNLSGTGVYTAAAGTITVGSGNTLTIASGATLDLSANNTILSAGSATISNSGIIKVGTGTLTIPNSTVGSFTFVNTNTIPQATYAALVIDASGKTLTASAFSANSINHTAGTLSSTGNLTINSTGTPGAFIFNTLTGPAFQGTAYALSIGASTRPASVTLNGAVSNFLNAVNVYATGNVTQNSTISGGGAVGLTVTLSSTVSGNVNINSSIAVNSSGSGSTVTISAASGTVTITSSGSISIGHGNGNDLISISASGDISQNGSISLIGSGAPGSESITISSSGGNITQNANISCNTSTTNTVTITATNGHIYGNNSSTITATPTGTITLSAGSGKDIGKAGGQNLLVNAATLTAISGNHPNICITNAGSASLSVGTMSNTTTTTIDYNKALTLGSITVTGASLTVGGTYQPTSLNTSGASATTITMTTIGALTATGTLTSTTGDISLTSEGASTLQAVTSAGALTLSKYATAATYTVAVYTISSTGTLTISSGATLTCSGATAIHVGGNWVNSGTFNRSTSTVTFNGATAHTISPGSSSFYNIIFNNASGSWTMNSNLTATNDITITNGGLILGDYGVFVGHVLSIDISGSGSATWNENQRKTFYDTGNSKYWAFYYTGSGVQYAYSTDTSTWTTVSTLGGSFTTPTFTVAYGAGYAVVATVNGYNIVLNKGAVSATSIGFGSEVTVFSGTSDGDYYSKPTLAIGTDNYVWAAASHYVQGTYYQVNVKKSTNVVSGDISAWPTTAVKVGESSQTLSDIVLLPGASGTMNILASGISNNITHYYYNGTNWTEPNDGGDYAWFAFPYVDLNGAVYAMIIWNGNLYVGGDFTTAGGSAINHIAEWNGSAWVDLAGGVNGSVRALTTSSAYGGNYLFVGGLFTTAGSGQTDVNYIAMWNGTSWYALGGAGNEGTNGPVYALATSITYYDIYVGGAFTTAGGNNFNYVATYNYDGGGWSATGAYGSVNGTVRALKVTAGSSYGQEALFAGGDFTIAYGYHGEQIAANRIAVSDNAGSGSNYWDPVGDGFNGTVYAIDGTDTSNVYAGGDFTNAGSSSVNYIAKWDGNSWSALGLGMNGAVRAILYDSGSDYLFVGGDFTTADNNSANHIALRHNDTWSALDTGMNASVRAIARDVNNYVCAGGDFTQSSGVNTSYLSIYSGGITWSPITPASGAIGTNGLVYAMAVLGTDIYVGGNFTTAGGLTVNRIAKYTPSTGTWAALIDNGHNGLNSLVKALVVIDGKLYIGGGFSATSDNAITLNRFAMWDGSWHAFVYSGNTGVNSYVNTMATDGTDLYVGGYFTDAGGIAAADRIAKWTVSTSTWSALGNGLNNYVNTIVLSGSDVYVGGGFTKTGDNVTTLNYIAKYNGSWNALTYNGNTGVNSVVNAIAVVDATHVYVGGFFTLAGGVTNTNYIAKWNGSSWSALGTGMNNSVRTLVILNSIIYVGGDFTTANGVTVNRAAKYDPSNSTFYALNAGNDVGFSSGGVYTLLVNGNDIYAGGNFIDVKGISSGYIAKYIPTGAVDVGSNVPISAVMDSNHNVNLIYTNTSNQLMYRQFNAALSSWSSAVTLYAGIVTGNPTLSINNAGNTLYAFWDTSSSIYGMNGTVGSGTPTWGSSSVRRGILTN